MGPGTARTITPRRKEQHMSDITTRMYVWVSATIESMKYHVQEQSGQDLIEYALISGLVAVAIITGFLLLPANVTTLSNAIAECIDFDTTCP
jgi:Flp pilus assembly pilin Flp